MEAVYDEHINTILNTSLVPSHLLPATVISIAHEPYYYLRNEASTFERQLRGYMDPKRINDYKRKLKESKPKVCTCTIKELTTLEDSEDVTEPQDDRDHGHHDSDTDSDKSVTTTPSPKQDCISLRSHSEVYNQLRYGQVVYEQGEPRKYGQLWTEIWLERHWSKQWHPCSNDVSGVKADRRRRKKARKRQPKLSNIVNLIGSLTIGLPNGSTKKIDTCSTQTLDGEQSNNFRNWHFCT